MIRAKHWTEIPDISTGARVLDLGAGGRSISVHHRNLPDCVFCTSEIRLHHEAVEAGRASSLLVDVPDDDPFDDVLFEPPQRESKTRVFELFDRAFESLKIGGKLWLAGRKNRGVDSYRRRLGDVFGNVTEVGRAGRVRVYSATREQEASLADDVDPVDAFDLTAQSGETIGIHTRAGVFSADGFDPGSQLLSETVGHVATGTVLDVCCGAGTIGLSLVAGGGNASLVLSDSSLLALECVERNIHDNGMDNRARGVNSDLYSGLGNDRYDVIVSNPPFHEGSAVSDPLIEGSALRLNRGGRLWLVVMREGPYLRGLEAAFADVRVVAKSGPYSILCGEDPFPA